MNAFIHFRDNIRKYILQREMLFLRIWNMLISLVGFFSVKSHFGYNTAVSQWWICLIMGLACGFLPLQGISFVVMLYMILNLMSLNIQVALVSAGFVVVAYLLCAYFRSKNTYNIFTVPVLFGFHCPYVMTLGAGLMSNLNELCSILCGTVIGFYLHVIKSNAAVILDETTEFSIIALLKEQLLQNKMFYFYLVAMTAMFVVVYIFRSASIKMSWLIADAAGVLVEFVIMLSGFLLTGQRAEVPVLIFGNIIVLAVGFLLNYFVLDLDYSRIEKVQFEDDDYYYYVTAVPKIRIAHEEKEIKTF